MRDVYGNKPRMSTLLAALSGNGKIALWPCIGGGAAGIGVSGVSRGNPTVLRLASTPTFLVGQKVRLYSLGGITTLNGNSYTVLGRRDGVSNAIAIDVDSSAMADWTSGGTCAGDVFSDVFGNAPTMQVAGTLTNVWDQQQDGILSAAAGTYSSGLMPVSSLFSMTGFTGMLLLAMDYYAPASLPTSGSGWAFSSGRPTNSGAKTASGCVSMGYYGGSSSTVLMFRPACASDGSSVITTRSAPGLVAAARNHVAYIVDCRTPAAPVIYGYLNGQQRGATNADMTAATGLPTAADGVALLSGITTTGTQNEYLGPNGTASRVRNLLWAKLSASTDLAVAQRIIQKLAVDRVMPYELATYAV